MIDNRFLLEDDVTFMVTEDDEDEIEQEGPRASAIRPVRLRRPRASVPETRRLRLS